MIDAADPPSQSPKLGVSPQMIRNILKKDLAADERQQRIVQDLSERHAKQSLDRANGFKKYLSRRKLKYLFTMDEMPVNTNDINGKTKFFFRRRGVA